MAMQRWDPFGEMLSLRTAMDRLFEDAWVRPGRAGTQPNGTAGFPLDLYEQDDRYTVKASLPGVKPEDVNVTARGNMLTIEGETHQETEQRGTVHHQEHRYGKFVRTITLPGRFNADQAQVGFEHGILTLTLPKVEEARTRQIPIKPAETVEAQPKLQAAETNGGKAARS